MKKQNLLSKAELRKVLGGSPGNGACSTSPCYFEYMSVGYYSVCGSTIQEGGSPGRCTCSAMGPFGDWIEDDVFGNCYVA